MNAEQRVSAPRRSQLAVSTAFCGRGARFTVAQDARRGDPGPTISWNLGNDGYRGWGIERKTPQRKEIGNVA
jgi:hypothetical protein